MSSYHIAPLEIGDSNGVHAQADESSWTKWLLTRFPKLRSDWFRGSSAAETAFTRLPSTAADEESGVPSANTQFTYSCIDHDRWCPEETANFLAQLLFTWVSGLLDRGKESPLQHTDLWDVAAKDDASQVSKRFLRPLTSTVDEVQAPQGRVGVALWRTHRRLFVLAGFVKLLHDGVMFLGPFLLEMLLKHLKAGGCPWRGFGLACALAGAAVVETLTVNIYFHMLFRMCLHVKTQLVDLLYAKSLRVSGAVKARLGIGTIVNLQSNDAAKLWNLPQYLHMLWSGPLQIFVVMALLIRVIGVLSAMVGLGVTMALIPLSAFVASALARIRHRVIKLTDARVKLCGEVITGIKAIKLYAWEVPYLERITATRDKELREIRSAALVGTWNTMLWVGGPLLIAMSAFLSYTMLGLPLLAEVAFPALSLFNLLRFPVMMFPSQLNDIINAKVALGRIQNFIEAEEVKAMPECPAVVGNYPDPDCAIVVRNGTFFATTTHENSTPLLRDVELTVGKSQLVVVIGAVASGKTSLLAALLGELSASRGTVVSISGTIAYAQQDPWIQNATLRDNILMGSPFEASKYETVLAACALGSDLAMLPAGDLTEIGEKGVNLSGGQKHRVALARACYADADIYLMDDPLSAVDSHVGRHLFERCILGLLRDKTRVLVTHHLHTLPASDVVCVVEDRRITHQGKYAELRASGVDFHQVDLDLSANNVDGPSDANGTNPHDDEGTYVLQSKYSNPAQVVMDGHTSLPSSNSVEEYSSDGLDLEEVPLVSKSVEFSSDAANGSRPKRRDAAKLIEVEDRAMGNVKRAVYLRYFSSWGSRTHSVYIFNFLVPSIVLVLATLERGLQVGQNWTLSSWAEAAAAAGSSTTRYTTMYFILGLSSLGFQIFKTVFTVLGAVAAARRLHASLLDTILRLPMSFFDSQPTGRLLNRFTKDTEAVDMLLQSTVASFMNCAVSVLWSLAVVVAVSPGVILAVVPLAFAFGAVQRRYIATSRELKRLDSLALSPIFSHFSETIAGLATVRAFRAQNRFRAQNTLLLNESNRCYWPSQCVNRWLSVRLELLGIGVVFGTAIFVAVAAPTSTGLAGLALTSALNLTGLMNWMVRQSTELEVNMNSVERMVEYDTQAKEAPAIVPERRPPPGWPTRGAVSVENLVVRYRPDLDPVLRGLSFSINPLEKVGVVGRTGCGKSTLMLALYRIVEPAEGRILIDGVDISSIGLRDLRSRLALVPQDPVIFSGTVRSNLDPFGGISTAVVGNGGALPDGNDSLLWSALERAGMANAVRAMPAGLDSAVAEGGLSMSAGQRQLLCMARALLRPARILVLDEATSSIDTATDAVIQSTIATAFADKTVLTIAHRLQTILTSDRVLVLGEGRVKEFDSPQRLMHRPDGLFRGFLVEALGVGTGAERIIREIDALEEQGGSV